MFIDLSVPLNDKTPAYPGDPKIEIVKTESFESQGYLGHSIKLGTHSGTHIDAPLHMIEGADGLSSISLEQCVGPGKLIDVRDGFDIQKIVDVDPQPGDIVLFWTGMSDKLYNPEYFDDYPVMSAEIAQLLAQKQVKMVGVDTCSVDNTEGFPVHKALLGAGILLIENLTNLENLAGKGFRVLAFPIKLAKDGAPARVVAEVLT